MFTRMFSQGSWRILLIVFAVALLFTMFSNTASAQPWNKKTTVTFSAPVEIPGVGAQVLPAGTYMFKLLDSLSDRHIVQVFSEDGSHLYATILAIPNYRLKPTDKTVMTFSERAAGNPQAVRAWFYPGDNWGQEFAYPKTKAAELARLTNLPVVYIPDEMGTEIVAPAKTATAAPVIALEEVPLRAVKPSGEDAVMAEIIVAPPVSAETSLPKTASEIPLLAFAGLLCVAIGVALRASCAR